MKAVKSHRVLIVEDADELARLMQIMLRDMGIESQYVCTGHGALEVLAHDPPDLMILDLGLPEMSGWQVLDIAEERNYDLSCPVIVLTARDDATNRLIGRLHKPVVRYLFKPFKIQTLSTAVREALNLPEP